jgi:uncharacterized protein YfaS (alpha-2-macroglobulin family)
VNLNPVLEGSFTADNITESQSVSLSISDLASDEISFLEMERGLGVGRLYYTIHLNSYLGAATADAVNRGISVQRFYYDAACQPGVDACQPIDAIESGQQVRVELTIVAQDDLHYAIIEDPIPSGAEAIDPGLDTSVAGLGEELIRDSGDYRYGYWGWWYFNRIEYRDEKVMFTSEFLPAGNYLYTYYLQTNITGEYQVMPTTARQEFFPDVFGRSNGALFTIMP